MVMLRPLDTEERSYDLSTVKGVKSAHDQKSGRTSRRGSDLRHDSAVKCVAPCLAMGTTGLGLHFTVVFVRRS